LSKIKKYILIIEKVVTFKRYGQASELGVGGRGNEGSNRR
jgi:hypothetical protein